MPLCASFPRLRGKVGNQGEDAVCIAFYSRVLSNKDV